LPFISCHDAMSPFFPVTSPRLSRLVRSQTDPSKGRGRGKVSYPGPRNIWGHRVARKYKVTRMRQFKKKSQQFSPRRNRARMLPRAALWLSTGLLPYSIRVTQADLSQPSRLGLKARNLIGCLHDQANIEQTSSN